MAGIVTHQRLCTMAQITTPPVGDDPDLRGLPVLPVGWTQHVVSGGWSQQTRDSDGARLACYRMSTTVDSSSEAAYLILQHSPEGAEALDAFTTGASYKNPTQSTWQQSNAGPNGVPGSRNAVRAVCDWVITGAALVELLDGNGEPMGSFEWQPVTNERRRVKPHDTLDVPDVWGAVPASGYWSLDAAGLEVPDGDPSEVLRVSTWHRPALSATMAGYDDPGSVEAG